jgi:DNA-binding response OmpR family regulator
MAQKILIIEDERAIAEAIAHTLRREGFETHVASNGEAGIKQTAEVKPDLIILDLMLPGINGLDVCRVLRRSGTIPILMLTARAEEMDMVVGLEVGADEYVTKPFGMRALVARVRALLRRQEMALLPSQQSGYSDDYLVIDLSRPAVQTAGKDVALTPQELALLRVLLTHRGRARSREQLLEEAWGGDEYIDQRTVDVHIRWLRQKLEPDAEHPRYIETVRGIGYRFSK